MIFQKGSKNQEFPPRKERKEEERKRRRCAKNVLVNDPDCLPDCVSLAGGGGKREKLPTFGHTT